MRLILDTHTILWFLEDHPNLSKSAKDAILSADEVFWNHLSLWELSIKTNRNICNLKLTADWAQKIVDELAAINVSQLKTTPVHFLQNSKLPKHHRDPFDRLLISIAITEDLTIITRDSKFSQYPVKTLW